MKLKFWIKNAVVYAFAGIAGAAVYSLMMFLMDPTYQVENLMDMASGYLLGIGVVMSIVIGMMDYKTTLPLVLSFGCTRKRALVDMQFGRLLYIAIFTGAVVGFYAVTNGWDVFVVIAPITIGLMLAMTAIGAVFGMVSVKFGKVAAIVVGVLIGVLAAGCALAAVFLVLSMEDVVLQMRDWVFWLIPAVGAVIYGLVLILEYKTVYKYNVKL